MFKTENGYFSPYLLNKKPVLADREGYCKYFYMESYNTVEERIVSGKKQKITVCRSRKKYFEVPIEQWKQLHYLGMTVAQYRDKILFPHGKQKIIARFEQYFKLKNKSKK